MNKRHLLFTLIVSIMVVVAAIGCSSSAPPQESKPTSAPPKAQSTAAPAGASAAPAKPIGPLTLELAGWTYDNAKVRDNLGKFQTWASKLTPPITATVNMSDAGYGEFDTFITTRSAAGTSFDVLYSSDHWLPKWAEAGWVAPLEEIFPEAKSYIPEMLPYVTQAMTYKGKLFGLPYYTDTMYFIYNKKMLADAGISSSPTTWQEVSSQAKTIKQKGITPDPVMIGLKAGSWFEEAFYAMVYSEGGKMFDDKLEPVFDSKSGAAYDVLQWLATSINDDQIMPKKVLDMTAVDVQQAFKEGQTAFVIVPGYMIREFNNPATSKISGQAMVAMMPGKTHDSNGFTRMHLLGKGALKDDGRKVASYKLLEFLSAKVTIDGASAYHIPKRWAVENGLGFAYPTLWQDADVLKAFEAAGDLKTMQAQQKQTKSKEGIAAPWFAEWISFVRSESQKALLRQSPTTAVLDGLKDRWSKLKKQ